jgi:hypothetical protein
MLAAAFLAAALICQPQPSAPAPPQTLPQVTDLRLLSLDELIDQLPPVDQEWDRADQTHNPYAAEMKRRIGNGDTLTDDQWKRALTRSQSIVMRSAWLADHPFAVPMQAPSWLPLCEIVLSCTEKHTARLECGSTFRESCGLAASARRQQALTQILGIFPKGRRTLTFNAFIKRGREAFAIDRPPAGRVWTGTLAFDVDFVATLDEVLPPLKGDRIDNALRDSIGLDIKSGWGQKNETVAIVVVDIDAAAHPELASAAILPKIELLRGDEVTFTAQTAVSLYDNLRNSNSVYRNPVQLFTFVQLRGFDPAIANDPEALSHWKLRVSSCDDYALRMWHANTRWVGRFELPLAQALKTEKGRTDSSRMYLWMP